MGDRYSRYKVQTFTAKIHVGLINDTVTSYGPRPIRQAGEDRQLRINPKKTVIILFTTKRSLTPTYHRKMLTGTLKLIKSIRYLELFK